MNPSEYMNLKIYSFYEENAENTDYIYLSTKFISYKREISTNYHLLLKIPVIWDSTLLNQIYIEFSCYEEKTNKTISSYEEIKPYFDSLSKERIRCFMLEKEFEYFVEEVEKAVKNEFSHAVSSLNKAKTFPTLFYINGINHCILDEEFLLQQANQKEIVFSSTLFTKATSVDKIFNTIYICGKFDKRLKNVYTHINLSFELKLALFMRILLKSNWFIPLQFENPSLYLEIRKESERLINRYKNENIKELQQKVKDLIIQLTQSKQESERLNAIFSKI